MFRGSWRMGREEEGIVIAQAQKECEPQPPVGQPRSGPVLIPAEIKAMPTGGARRTGIHSFFGFQPRTRRPMLYPTPPDNVQSGRRSLAFPRGGHALRGHPTPVTIRGQLPFSVRPSRLRRSTPVLRFCIQIGRPSPGLAHLK